MIPMSPARALVVKRTSSQGVAHFRSFRGKLTTQRLAKKQMLLWWFPSAQQSLLLHCMMLI